MNSDTEAKTHMVQLKIPHQDWLALQSMAKARMRAASGQALWILLSRLRGIAE